MMDREQLINMLGSMDTGSLIKMLATQGVKIEDPGCDMDMDEDDSGSKVADWNTREVQVGSDERPKLFDKHKFLKMDIKQPMQQAPEYLNPEYSPNMEAYSADMDRDL